MSATLLLPAPEDIAFSEGVGINETLSADLNSGQQGDVLRASALLESIGLDLDELSPENRTSEKISLSEMYVSRETQSSEAEMCAAMSDTTWSALYPALRSLACFLVRTSSFSYWYGQEDDMAEDIVQETARRVIERAQKAERGEATPIQSLKQMATTVAYNYCRDLKRRDYRLSRMDTADAGTHTPHFYPVDVGSDEHILDAVADKVDQDRLFDMLAGEIDQFPAKQKHALLVDLANRMSFDEEPTPLQASFLDRGIELRHYCQPLPDDPRERGRHISLCSQAYKRIARLCAEQRL